MMKVLWNSTGSRVVLSTASRKTCFFSAHSSNRQGFLHKNAVETPNPVGIYQKTTKKNVRESLRQQDYVFHNWIDDNRVELTRTASSYSNGTLVDEYSISFQVDFSGKKAIVKNMKLLQPK